MSSPKKSRRKSSSSWKKMRTQGKKKQLTDLFHGGLRWGNGGKPLLVYCRRLKKPRVMLELEEPGYSMPSVVKSEYCMVADVGPEVQRCAADFPSGGFSERRIS
ncbi:hypothetical protein KSP40_PGU004852 [Platanthera guangdongensis]|uniref:Uncharacterized protein n=1 Tax=Platanthera guangdongensis TaxID=2320717 RepID=A0ABR2MHU6_9ASPA